MKDQTFFIIELDGVLQPTHYETYNEAYNKFSQFVASCKSTEDLESKAEEFGYTVLEQNNLFNSAHNVANIAQTRNAIKWLFSEAKVGQVSPLYECGIITIDYSWAEIDFVSRPMEKLMLEECCMRSCEPDEAYDIDINPDDIDVTDNVTVVWGIK